MFAHPRHRWDANVSSLLYLRGPRIVTARSVMLDAARVFTRC
jgi:hypothetical protein